MKIKVKAHIRRINNKKIKIKPHIRKINNKKSYGFFPLRNEKDLKIAWDKLKLADFYDAEFLQPQENKMTEAKAISKMNKDEFENAQKYDQVPPYYVKNVTSNTKTMYDNLAKGLKKWDPVNKVDKIIKVPFEELPQEAKIEVNLIRGGFYDNEMPEEEIMPGKKFKKWNTKIIDPMKIKKIEERKINRRWR